MNPVRIAHILPWSGVGGTELATMRLAEAAAESGFENLLYCPPDSESLRCTFQKHGLTTCCYRQVEPSYHKPIPYLRAARQLAHSLRKHHVRIVHCSDILAAHYAALAGRLAGAYVLSHVRCQHSAISARDRTFLLPVNKFVFVSRDTWHTFGMEVPTSRGQVLYDGFSETHSEQSETLTAAREKYGLPVNAFVIGMASRVHPCKDFETLVHASKLLIDRFPDCRVLLAGDYSQEPAHARHYEQLQQLLRQVGLRDHFVFAGFEADMERFFAAVDVFALSTHAEGFPLAVIEAMSHGKPVVATAVGGIPEAVVDHETGYLIPPKSPELFADALIKLRQDPDVYARLSEAGRSRMKETFSAEQFQHRVRNLYACIARHLHLIGNDPPCMST